MTPQKKMAYGLVGVAAMMLSLSFAAVPFYNWFCKVTGYAGTVSVAETGADEVLAQTVKIRFDASLEAGMQWEFKPQVHQMTVHIGETALAFYEAYNPTDRVIAGTASYNVMPDLAGGYFTKIECFCFTEQVLQPGERVVMPSGGQTPSTSGLIGPIGYSAFLKKAQNQAEKNITSDMMNMMKP